MSDKNIKTISSLMFKDKTYEEAKSMDFVDIVCNINSGGDYIMNENYTYSRTNYFKVKDIDKLKELANLTNATVIEKNGYCSLFCNKGDREYDKSVDFYFDKDLREHVGIHYDLQKILEDEETAVFMEVGKLGSKLVGVAVIVTTEAIEVVDLFDVIEELYNVKCFEEM